MRFEEWEPIYQEILDDFGFGRERDEEAARLLSALLAGRQTQEVLLRSRLEGRSATIFGNAPSLPGELQALIEGRDLDGRALVAADGAAAVLLDRGLIPDAIVTDLDGDVPAIIAACQRGAVVVVHAHGDNMDRLREFLPRLPLVVGTAQSAPVPPLHNFGGFTDGDRCVFMALAMGCRDIRLVGFDLDDPSVTPRKKKKLDWARRLIDRAGLSSDGP
ncbi:MAG: 6-hydroxymethyl-7,8-dihydropterin pyrophosphokinase [Methanosaeta sp. PtaU1.Bin028]|nr:MAG: 6-hydroxymethyl-7,8-dihydropterin pyrophosphokinase [Methanosaeta sp. PtaU1.Bin028]